MKNHYSYLDHQRLLVNWNWAHDFEEIVVNVKDIRNQYGYSSDDKVCLFGGNVGKPQAIHNLIALAEKMPDIQFLFVGKGTELEMMETLIQELKNIKYIPFLSRDEYKKLAISSDIGLVSLDERFTVPNFPSKTADYLTCGLPIFALLDECSSQDYGQFLQKNKIGSFAHAKDLLQAESVLRSLLQWEKEQKKYCKIFAEKYLDVGDTVRSLFEKIKTIDSQGE